MGYEQIPVIKVDIQNELSQRIKARFPLISDTFGTLTFSDSFILSDRLKFRPLLGSFILHQLLPDSTEVLYMDRLFKEVEAMEIVERYLSKKGYGSIDSIQEWSSSFSYPDLNATKLLVIYLDTVVPNKLLPYLLRKVFLDRRNAGCYVTWFQTDDSSVLGLGENGQVNHPIFSSIRGMCNSVHL